MADRVDKMSEYARVSLAGIRILNGGIALIAPKLMARRLGVDPTANPAMLYALRMFGVRTVVIGAQLLLPDGPVRAQAVRTAPVIHASDATAAALAARTGRLPGRMGLTTTLISTVNTVLALMAQARTADPARR